MTRTIDKKSFVKSTRILRVNQQVSPTLLARLWTEIGYSGREIVLEPGTFSLRGGLLDVWPFTEKTPLRLDFFGDEIDAIYSFNPATQRNLERMERILVPPAREIFQRLGADGSFGDEPDEEFLIPLRNETPACLLIIYRRIR